MINTLEVIGLLYVALAIPAGGKPESSAGALR